MVGKLIDFILREQWGCGDRWGGLQC